MSYFIQSYGKGYIQRNGDKYELVVNGEMVGSYKSIETLVKYNPIADGKQVSKVDEEVKDEPVAEVVSTAKGKKSRKEADKK